MDFYDALWADMRGGIELLVVARARRRRWLGVATTVLAISLTVGGVAVGASQLFGWPAPAQVQKEISAVDQGLPEDLRLNPDVSNARAVAATSSSTLYAADLRDGGHCSEIVTAGDRGRGAVCTTGAELARRPIEVTLPTDQAVTAASAIAIGGRVNVEAQRVDVSYGGSSDRILLGDDGYFVFEVPREHLAAAHASEIVLTATAGGGRVVARVTVPADWDEPAVSDNEQPLFVSTRSRESDFTKVYGIEGHVGSDDAVRLELSYDDGETVRIPIEPDGRFLYSVPNARVGAFMRPALLVARDSRGRVVAQTMVAAVAYWRGAQRHR